MSAQKDKLIGLDLWSKRVARTTGLPLPAWSMAWAWISDTETCVDLFDPGAPVALSTAQVDQVDQVMDRRCQQLLDEDSEQLRSVRVWGLQATMATRMFSGEAGRPSWLTVTIWRERLVAEDATVLIGDSITDRDLELHRWAEAQLVTVGAHMMSAITDRPPDIDDLAALFRTGLG